MATNRYSLTDYTVTVAVPSSRAGENAYTLSFGGFGDNGEGSFLGQIQISRSADLWSTDADESGSWVHNKNYDKTGTVSMQLRQISDQVISLIQLTSRYEMDDLESGLHITVSKGGDIYADCVDCYPTKVPDQNFGGTAEMQDWSFTCGRIVFPI